jgi:hypothetical protein
VGLPEWRTGNFSTAMRDAGGRAEFVPIYDPETGTGTFGQPRGTTPFPGNVIPSSRLDPVALKVLAYYPNPNRTPNNSFNQQGNFAENGRNEILQNYWIARIDHDLTSKTKMYGRYIIASPRWSSGGGSPSFGPAVAGERSDDRLQNYALNFNHLFSPTFFATLTAGVERLKVAVQGGCAWCGENYADVLGVKGVPGPVFPQFALGSGFVPVRSVGGGPDRFANVTNSNVLLDFTKVRGNHTWKFGGQYSRFNNNTRANTQASGAWNFDGHFTRGVTETGSAVANTGINMADFLLGRITSASANVAPTLGRRAQYFGVYFQEDWRVNSRLTLNLGMRWDTQNPTHGVDDRMTNFDPYQVSPLAGTGDIPAGAMGLMTYQNKYGKGKYLWEWDKKTFSPRFGFAWRVFGTNDTVLRGGYGIFFGSPTTGGTNGAGILGYGLSFSVGDPVPFRLRDGAPAGALAPPPESELTPAFGQRGTAFAQSGISFYDPYAAYPYTQNFNLTFQHQWKGTLFEVGYMGNLGRHLASAGLNLNRIPTELLARTDISERLKRPFTVFTGNAPGVSDSEYRNGLSNYNALTLKVERRFSQGLSYSVAYTYAKLIDDINYQTAFAYTWGDNTGPQNIYDRRNERSLSTNCIPQRLVVAPVYELPVGKGRRFLNQEGVTDWILGGWQVSSVGKLQSGAPFGVTVLNGGRDVLGDQSGTLRPNLIGDPESPNQGQPAVGVRGLQWFDPAAFAVPGRYTYGNAARTIPGLLTPGIVNFDIMIGKNFRFKERYRAQFRWEMLDAFNTPAFDNIGRWPSPSQAVGAGNFGLVTQANALSRRIMQFGLKLYW